MRARTPRRAHLRQVVSLLVVLLLGATSPSAAVFGQQTYYLSPEGSDRNTGTIDEPWATLAKASREARAGDTVLLLEGTYAGTLRPVHSGTVSAPIIFRAAERRTARLLGTSGDAYAIHLDSVAHIHIEGLHIRPQSPAEGRFMKIERARHVQVDDCLMEKTAGGSGLGGVPFVIKDSEHVALRNSIVREKVGGDLTHVYNSKYILFEGNAISRAGHSPMAFSPRISIFKQASHIVVRSNVFHAGWGRPFEFFGEPTVLFENNIIAHAYHGSLSAGSEAKIMLEDGIVRFNRVFRNWGSPLNMGYYNPAADANHAAIYNNVFDDNYRRALRVETINDYIFKNNIFSRNDRFGGGRQLLFGATRSGFLFERNAFWAGGKEEVIDASTGELLSLEAVQSERWRSAERDRRDNLFRDNLNVEPGYAAPDDYNHALRPESPLRDRGHHLTQATGSGSGALLTVADARYFYDGFGIEGQEGDLIAVGTPRQTARVVQVDRERNMLLLDRSVSWSEGEPVGLPWAGAAPDMGVYEHGRTGRVSVQITTQPFVAHPGEEVTLQATVYGNAEPVAYHWRIGDRATAEGQTVKHRFDGYTTLSYSPTGVPVHCRVETADGRTFLAAGLVELAKERPLEKPLVYLSFDEDPFDGTITVDDPDSAWWWFWYRSRPNPDVRTEIQFEEDGNGVVRFTAPEDGHHMSVRAYPGQWNLDNYPKISFRYRLDPGLPLGLYIQGFDAGGQERRVYLALHEDVHIPPESRRAGTAQFVADGLWHTIELDASSIRDHYPAINVLQEIRFEAVGLDQVEEGESFWLDEFYIAPDEYDVKHAGLAAGSSSQTSSRTVRVSGENVEARLLYADDFEDMDDWVHLVGDSTRWSIEDGRLVGRYGPGGSTVWSRPSFEGDVLVEFDGEVLPPDQPWITENIPDGGKNLNFHFMVTGPDGEDILKAYPALHRSGTGPNGAGFDQYNGYFLTWTYRHARLRRSPGYRNMAETTTFLPEISERYRFRLLRRDGRIRYWINEHLVLDYADPDPWQRGKVGFALWRSNVAIDNFKVYRVLDAQGSQ